LKEGENLDDPTVSLAADRACFTQILAGTAGTVQTAQPADFLSRRWLLLEGHIDSEDCNRG